MENLQPSQPMLSKPEHEPPQQPRQLEEETPIQQPQQQPPQDDVIEISSCSDDEQPPDHMEVLHPLVPKVEELQEDQPPRVLEQPSQTVVEVLPIYPTQEVIDVSSGSEDERQPLIKKIEEYHVYSSNPPLFTTQDLSDIEELEELVKKAQDQFQTSQTKKSLENQKDLEEKVVTWATVPKGENEFETIFKLVGDRFLESIRKNGARKLEEQERKNLEHSIRATTPMKCRGSTGNSL
ncbi:hypothetical protein PIB30_077275 [Stylosanthes scabra]|uniref:Uncharacterized protein n=1 Tax=Stylosanthes scabra TaxID=79078 RepID=A0ABU6VSJ0_9FABA|nr:hypothetical protein [Stylosanthes scabra]